MYYEKLEVSLENAGYRAEAATRAIVWGRCKETGAKTVVDIYEVYGTGSIAIGHLRSHVVGLFPDKVAFRAIWKDAVEKHKNEVRVNAIVGDMGDYGREILPQHLGLSG